MLVKVTITGEDFGGANVLKTRTFASIERAFAWAEFLSGKILKMKTSFDFIRT